MDQENKPKLNASGCKSFISILQIAMKVARTNGMDEMAMIRDVQSQPTMEERKERLSHYFEVI